MRNYSCDNLQDALKRYNGMLFKKNKKTTKHSKHEVTETLKELNVYLTNPCEEYPSLNMDEKCELMIFILPVIQPNSYIICIL